ncbi:flotillin family protein [Vagococcus zengguangii]|uniref:Flotillin family protein n=1 Tax=Vagococcus zengguangii TaxID=2571750 RepID=A0A4D7CVQ5_9ENTE|nr:SPFH domain-containing protein [Vagococcus zengguangii]QCI86341.1 flotillin family protein [Vagococcus zengguangii]TLG81416.1 flotillin family protein [Vagococcus zengguangii]
MNVIMTLVPVIIILALIAIGLFSCYRTVPNNEVMLVYGGLLGNKNTLTSSSGSKLKMVSGGGSFVIPIVQSTKRMKLENMKLDVSVEDVPTKAAVPVNAEGTVVIKIGNSQEAIMTHAQQFMDKHVEEKIEQSREVLEGHLRAILGTLTVEEIYQERDQFANRVQEQAETDLANMGLTIVSFTIRDINDENGYFEAIAQPRIAAVKKDAQIATAIAEKETRIKRAEAEKEAKEREISNATMIAEATKDKELKIASYIVEQDTAKAKADNAYAIEKAKLDIELKSQQMNIEIQERKKQIELEEQEILRREKQYDSEVKKKADADRYQVEQASEAEKFARVKEAEAQKELVALEAQGQAESIRAIGEAEALAKTQVGQAEANAKEMMAEALRQYGEAAIKLELIDRLPEIVKHASEPIGNISDIRVIEGGSGEGQGASKIAGLSAKNIAASSEILEQVLGINLGNLIQDFAGTRTGVQAKRIADALNSDEKKVENEETSETNDSESNNEEN